MRIIILLSSGLLFFSCGAFSDIRKDINISVYITKKITSKEVQILGGDITYEATYDRKEQRFPYLSVPFSIRSPLSVSDSYDLTLTESIHYCSGSEIMVQTYLDDDFLNKKDVKKNLIFNHSDDTYKWRKHILGFSFPQIKQGDSEIQCYGLVGLMVELTL